MDITGMSLLVPNGAGLPLSFGKSYGEKFYRSVCFQGRVQEVRNLMVGRVSTRNIVTEDK